ncbi:hypothetical protein PDJ95_07875 [Bacillus cereus]|nr:hypothetical protein [Bacillus cereus]MDA2092399.1 hypothetical protein [Bacillus cereus]
MNRNEGAVKGIPEQSLWFGLAKTSAIVISEYIVDADLTPNQYVA